MADVSGKLFDQFVDCLGSSVLAPGAIEEMAETPTAAADGQGPRLIDSPEAVPVDLLQAGGTPLLRRLLPVVGAVAVVGTAIVLLRRRRRA
jgi:hypothetical protein